jgi:hypothetical protein
MSKQAKVIALSTLLVLVYAAYCVVYFGSTR